MKTKNILYTTLILILTLNSCKDFLDEKNYTSKSEEIVFANDESLIGRIGSCYSYLKIWYGKEGGFGLTEGGTDLWYNCRDNSQTELATYNGITPETASAVFNEHWDGLYAGITLCNQAEDYISKTSIEEEIKNSYLGEVRFLRAFYYWHLVETWGPVEVITKPITTVSTIAYRHSVDSVYEQMFSDVQFAIDNIDPTRIVGARVSRWAAKAFKARLALYYASEYGHSDYYNVAATEAKELIAGSGKVLYDNYEDVWKIANNNIKDNNEFIWGVDYYDVINPSLLYNYLPSKPGGGNWNKVITRVNDGAAGGSGGNVLHLMVTPLWNTQTDGVGGPSVGDVLKRLIGPNAGFYTTTSPSIASTLANPFDPGYWYAKYAMGYVRYAPTRYCLDLFDETKDQRWNVTFRTAWYKHPNVVAKNFGVPKAQLPNPADSCKYPKMSNGSQTDTALFYSKRSLTPSQVAWASGRYKILSIDNTFNADGYTPNTNSGVTGANQMYAMWKKFENTDSKIPYSNANFNDYFSYRDFPVFRLAEAYLIASEALMNLGDIEALKWMNDLRAKRALPGADMTVSSVNLDLILEERAREFAGEEIRWFDLKRTHRLKQQLINNTKAYQYFDENKHYLRPIPAQMINSVTNRTPGPDPNGFWQNPGY